MKCLLILLIMLSSHHVFAGEEKSGIAKRPPAGDSRKIYVCNTGNTALKTYNGAIDAFNHLLPGQGVYLCRGGEFEVTRLARIATAACEVDQICTLGAYGEGEAPIVRSDGGVLNMTAAQGRAIKHVEIRDIRFIGPGYVEDVVTGIVVNGETAIEHVKFTNVDIEGFHTGMYQIQRINKAAKSVNVYGSRFLNNKGAGFLGGINDSELKGNVFKNSGDGKGGHQIYVAGEKTGLERFSVLNNIVEKNTPSSDIMCNRGPIVAHGIIDSLTIEGNHVIEDKDNTGGGCWGIAVDQGRFWPEKFTNLIIKRNIVDYAANTPIGCSNCPGAIIEDNVVTLKAAIADGIVIPTKTEGDGVITVAPIVRNNIINIEEPIATGNRRWGIRVTAKDAEVSGNTIKYPEGNRFFKCVEVNGEEIDGNSCVTN